MNSQLFRVRSQPNVFSTFLLLGLRLSNLGLVENNKDSCGNKITNHGPIYFSFKGFLTILLIVHPLLECKLFEGQRLIYIHILAPPNPLKDILRTIFNVNKWSSFLVISWYSIVCYTLMYLTRLLLLGS